MKRDVLEIVQGDSRFPLEVQLWERTDTPEEDRPIDLSDARKILLHLFFKGEPIHTFEMSIYTNPKNGTVMNEFWGDVWREKGSYRADVEIQYLDGGGSKTMQNQIFFKVREKGGK